jgi:hypothetical protein
MRPAGEETREAEAEPAWGSVLKQMKKPSHELVMTWLVLT